jgi:hypothetical protein
MKVGWMSNEKPERLPWYRAKDYKGKLTEDDKRQLDAFRMQESHPATDPNTLPDDVKAYINALEFELVELKRHNSITYAVIATVFALILAYYSGYLGNGYASPFVVYMFSALIIAVYWWKHTKEDKALVEQLLPSDSFDPTAEAIKFEWEVEYLVTKRRADRTDNDV